MFNFGNPHEGCDHKEFVYRATTQEGKNIIFTCHGDPNEYPSDWQSWQDRKLKAGTLEFVGKFDSVGAYMPVRQQKEMAHDALKMFMDHLGQEIAEDKKKDEAKPIELAASPFSADELSKLYPETDLKNIN